MVTLIKVGAVLILVVGAVYPLIGIFALTRRLNRTDVPAPPPLDIVVRMMLIATVPLAGILGGFAGLVPAVWASSILRVLIVMTATMSLAGFVMLALSSEFEQ